MPFPLSPLAAPVAAKFIYLDLAGRFGVILFHRGSWCPFCNAQLAAFSRAADKFAGEDIKVISVSADDREKTEALVEKYKLAFPVVMAPMHGRFRQSPAPSSTTIPSIFRRPGSSSIPKGRS
jgi:peroxiredoxin